MIQTLNIVDYRCFSKFQLDGLARVNLLVGQNNSGKSSVLEAISLLTSAGDPQVLWSILNRRGEASPEDDDQRPSRIVLDVSHLFRGHSIKIGSSFLIESTATGVPTRFQCRVIEFRSDLIPDPRQEALFQLAAKNRRLLSPAALEIISSPDKPTFLPLTQSGGIERDAILRWRNLNTQLIPDRAPARIITTESLGAPEIAYLWEKIALTPEEDRVVKALKIIEPSIERLAVVGGRRSSASRTRGGVVLKMQGIDLPVPIGSLGDGMWRMLAIAIALIRSENGVFLVDEIDTGLHYTVMEDMWRMIAGISRELNIQVFATTHSSDCVNSLAAIAQKNSDGNTEASLQRIERNNSHSITFTEREIAIAADRGVEVR